MSVRDQLRRELEKQRDAFTWPEPLHYQGPADFVLREGAWSRVHRTLPGVPRYCFANSIGWAARNRWTYVEGYALLPLPGRLNGNRVMNTVGDEVVHHAWVIDTFGRGYEVTWPVVGRAYLGIAFSVERADDATWNGDATVVDDFHRGHPLLRQPWTGETTWPTPLDAAAQERIAQATSIANMAMMSSR